MSDTETTTAGAEGEPHADEVADLVDAPDHGEDGPVGGAEPADEATLTEDQIVSLIAERDEYLEALQRMKAEFANARRRSDERAAAQRQQAAADLVERLLPVLDSAEAALAQGVEEVRPLSSALFDALAAQGLERLDPMGEPFDPERHEAVLFEAADNGDGEQVVSETMRTGYTWNSKVLRPAMVKVQG